MKSTDVPLPTLIGSFLKTCKDQGVEAVVWAAPRGEARDQIASNTGEAGVGKARARLVVRDGAIDAAARALHEFRFVEAGKEVEPGMDFCSYLPCLGYVDDVARAARRGYGAVPWDELPDAVKKLHRTAVTAILAAALSVSAQPPKPLVTV